MKAAVTLELARLADGIDRVPLRELDVGLALEGPFDLLVRPDTLLHLAWDGSANYKSLHHIETELANQYRFS